MSSNKEKNYIIVFVSVALAAGLRLWPLQTLESEFTWLTFYPAVIAVALYAGFYAGILATALACITVAFLWPLFVARPFIENRFDILEMLSFVIICSLISYLVKSVRHCKNTAIKAELACAANANRERFIRSIIDDMPNMIGYWDRDLRCRFANNAYLEWFGKRPEEIVGKTFLELAGERLYAMNEHHIQGALAGEPQLFDRALNKADGSVGHILGNYIPDFDADGVVKGFSILASEVTDLKEIEAEREILIASLQEALSEIKTLKGIIPICGYCHNIRDDEGAWAQLEAYLSKHSDAEFSHGICPKCIDKVRLDAGLTGTTNG